MTRFIPRIYAIQIWIDLKVIGCPHLVPPSRDNGCGCEVRGTRPASRPFEKAFRKSRCINESPTSPPDSEEHWFLEVYFIKSSFFVAT